VTDRPAPAPNPAGPEAMRGLVRDYVGALHASYLDHVRHMPPAERGALPLVAARGVTVVAAAAHRLHLIATTSSMPPPQGQEVELLDDYGGLAWKLRFYDPSVVPELGLVVDDQPEDVRRVLGLTDTVYHLTVALGGGLSGHHAQHSGVALANQDARTGRDLDRLRQALPHQVRTVDELGICVRVRIDRAAGLLAADLTHGRVEPVAGRSAASSLDAVLEDVFR
jgi:hypothetical protein